MRAVLILAVLMAWLYCLIGAIGFPCYLLFVGLRTARDRRRDVHRSFSPAPRVLMVALIVYVIVMVLCAVGLTASVLWGRPSSAWSGQLGSAVAWAALPAWSALGASITAMVLKRRRHRVPGAPHLSWGPSTRPVRHH